MGIEKSNDVEITCDKCKQQLMFGNKAIKITECGWNHEEVVCLRCFKTMMEEGY
jgi:hypothetical protein